MVEKIESGAMVTESSASRWRFARVDFDTRSGEIRVDGELVTLERKPREMLRVFLKRPGELLTKSELLDAVWPGRIASEGSLTNCIAKLRSAINDVEGNILRTVHGYGYRLACAVQIASHETEPSPVDIGEAIPVLKGWSLVRKLAQGLGTEVWRAQSAEDGTDHVLKLARSGSGLDQLRREVAINHFLQERLGAQMPAAAVLDAHLDEAPFFIELESYRGIALPEYLAAHSSRLDDARRVALAVRIVDAVASLHSYGVLHGGLTPGSFLLDDEAVGSLRVRFSELGHGQARELNLPEGLASRPEGLANPYAAPELLAGASPSLQSDVYALGVILYQVIAGDFTRPLAPGWEQQVHDALLCQDIAAASQLDPARRLGEAGELLRRLRELDGRRAEAAEVECRRARLQEAERALQRARARRAPLLALAVVLVAGLVVTSWLAITLRQAMIQEQRSAVVAAAVTEFLTKDLLAPANGAPGHAADVTIGTLLDRAAGSLQTRFAEQPLMLASLQRVLGTAYAALIEHDKAVPLLLAAETSLSKLQGPAASDTESTRLVLQELLVNAPLTPKRLEGIEAVAQRQLDAETAAGHPNPAIGFVARVPLAAIHCWRQAGIIRGANCGNALDEILAAATQRLGPKHPVTLRIAHSRASMLGVAGRVDEALPQFERALAGLQKIHGAGSPKLTLLLLQMSKGLEYGGDPARVIPLLEGAINNFSASLGSNHPYLWNARRALGMAYVRAGRHAEAIELQRRQLEAVTARYGAESRERLTALRFLAVAELAGGEDPQALAHIREGLALDAQVDADRYDRFELMDLLASALERRGEPAQAADVVRQLLLAIRSESPGAAVPIGRYELHGARLMLAEGLPEEASRAAARALASFAQAPGSDPTLVREAQRIAQATLKAAPSRNGT